MKLFTLKKQNTIMALFRVILFILVLIMLVLWYVKKPPVLENFFDKTTAAINANIDNNLRSHPKTENYSTTFSNGLSAIGSDIADINMDIKNSIAGSRDNAAPPRNSFLSDVIKALEKGVNNYKGDDAVMIAEPLPGINYTDKTPLADTITIAKIADVGAIIGDNCSTQSLLSSDYKEDVCKTYMGDFKNINEKCNALANNNCTILPCCVLLNGNKCVAGNVHGPTYLTDQGNTIDYNYYIHKGKIYPENYNYTQTGNYLKTCGMYAKNSTNISRACMVQLFNDAGCPNSSPAALINPSAVHQYSNQSKAYIENDLKNAVALLHKKIKKGDNDSRILCNGRDSKNPCDVYNDNDFKVSEACMIRMFNDAGCTNPEPGTVINPEFMNVNSSNPKSTLRSIISIAAGVFKYSADTAPKGSDVQIANKKICYGK